MQIPTEYVYNAAGIFGIICLCIWFIPGIVITYKRIKELEANVESHQRTNV